MVASQRARAAAKEAVLLASRRIGSSGLVVLRVMLLADGGCISFPAALLATKPGHLLEPTFVSLRTQRRL